MSKSCEACFKVDLIIVFKKLISVPSQDDQGVTAQVKTLQYAVSSTYLGLLGEASVRQIITHLVLVLSFPRLEGWMFSSVSVNISVSIFGVIIFEVQNFLHTPDNGRWVRGENGTIIRNLYRTTRRHIPAGSTLYIHSCDDIKSKKHFVICKLGYVMSSFYPIIE